MRHYKNEQIDYLVTQVTPKGLWDYCVAKELYDDSEYIRKNFLHNE
jgi:hypothetical protein